jgi:hypothetical protein
VLQGRPNVNVKNYIKIFLEKIGFEGVGWIKPAQVRVN